MKKIFFHSSILTFLLIFKTVAFASSAGSFGQPDSIIYQLNDLGKVRKAVYQYSSNKLSAIEVFESTSLNSQWTPYQKTVFSETGGIQSTVVQIYESLKSVYSNSQKTEMKFDSFGNRTLETYYVWDDTSSLWKGFRNKIERTYTDTGIMSAFTYSAWDSIAKNWSIYSSGTIKYNSFRKPEETIYYSPDGTSQLVISSKVAISYLPSYQPEYETTSVYSTLSGSYTPSFRTHYEYADTAPQYKETVETYSDNTLLWYPQQKTEKSYSLTGDLLSFMIADRDSVNQIWKERYRHNLSILSSTTDSLNVNQTDAPDGTTIYTKRFKQINNGNLTNITNTVEQNGSLISSQLTQFNTISGDVTAMTNQDYLENIKVIWDIDAVKNTIICSTYTIDDNTKAETLLRTNTLFFNTNATPLPKILDNNNLTFGPNPAKEVLNITNHSLLELTYRILSLEGKPLTCGASSQTVTTVAVNSLQPGAYILQLSLGKNKTKTSLFIKK